MTPLTLLDTDVLSKLMRRTPSVVGRAQQYQRDHARLTFSLMTRFEVLRGLRAKNAKSQLTTFEVFCAASEIVPITNAVVDRGADIYADLHRRGQLIGDADILIAATASVHGLVLATSNISDYGRITGLVIDDWAA